MPTGISANAHDGTPTLQVSDPRGLMVRTVQFHRREADDPMDTRVTEQRYDAVGRLLASRDPYLFDLARTDEATPFNLVQVTSLSGATLLSDSVDAGWRVALTGASGQGLESWDGRGSHFLTDYDELLRPAAIHERGHEIPEHTLERFTYADASAESAAHNLCGQIVRHDDPAGTVHVHDLNLLGTVLSDTRQFLRGTDSPDWPETIADRNALLETSAGATTLHAYAANGEPLSQTDALGNHQAFAYTIDGQLKNTRLTLAGDGQAEKVLVSDLHYNASGQIESEIAGNGVITRHHYDPANAQLTELSAHKADGTALQQLKYQYDPIGNVLSIEDAAQPIRYFNNQRIEPIKTYRYDTLDQLIEATGSEAKTGNGGPALPDLQPLVPDPDQVANYTQTFHYDAGGNLLKLLHVGAQAQGRTLTRARYSNRCLLNSANRRITEKEMDEGFDANGNLCALQAGQPLVWDLRNQMREVRPVVREEAEDDRECYVYDGNGQRVRKVRTWLTNARSITSEVRYLPGVEIRSHGGTGEVLYEITANAGSNSVRVLHWASKPPDEIAQDQPRYSLNDQVKSSTLELDQQANVISQEWYYAFGGTARWAGRNAIEAKYKTVRYSGKQRDATGLYYYGFRYYAPWLQRWINPDPAGNVDGMNYYAFVESDPVNHVDNVGLDKGRWQELVFKHLLPGSGQSNARGINFIGEQLYDPSRQKHNSRKFKGVKYYNQEERRNHKLTHSVADGAIRRISGNRAHYFQHPLTETITASSNWLQDKRRVGYVLAVNEKKLELAIFIPSLDKIHHSTPFSGRPVLDAGMMTIVKGGVAYIENKSGHYQPGIEQKLHTLKFLRSGGVDLRDTFISEQVPMKLDESALESFFYQNLYNAEDFYNFYMDTSSRHKGLSAKSIAQITSHAELPPTISVPTVGKDEMTPLESVTYRDWSTHRKGVRPEKVLKSSYLSYKRPR